MIHASRSIAAILMGCSITLFLSGCGGEDSPSLEFPDPPPVSVPAPPSPPTTPTPPPLVTPVSVPDRYWSLDALLIRGGVVTLDEGSRKGAVDAQAVAGGLLYAPQGFDGLADVAAYSNESGRTYWVSAEAPNGDSAQPTTSAFGSKSQMFQVHRFRKNTVDDSLRLLITQATVITEDFNQPNSHPDVCPWLPYNVLDHERCFDQAAGIVRMLVIVMTLPGSGPSNDRAAVYSSAAQIQGYNGHWEWTAGFVDGDMANVGGVIQPIFREGHFSSNLGTLDILPTGSQARIDLRSPVPLDVDLSEVAAGDEFVLYVAVDAAALNRQGRESYAAARFRDPIQPGEIIVEAEGLTELTPPSTLPTIPAIPLPECAAPSGSALPLEAGQLSFSKPAYFMSEFSTPQAVVFVHRVGGSEGVQVVNLSSSDNGATAGVDYAAVSRQIVWGDDDDAPRAIRLDVTDDTLINGDRNLSLMLTASSNCATIGRGITSVTIVDDDFDAPPLATGTVGGTVTGLVGTGLVLEDRARFIELPITANGPFEFNSLYSAGSNYDVRVRANPGSPAQVCTVANGTGITDGTPVTNVAVTCDSPVAGGGLDPTFGTGGLVTGPPHGSGYSVQRQTTGRLLVLMSDGAVARFTADGQLDASFGTNGVVRVDFGNATSTAVNSITLQSDDRILLTGALRVTSTDQDMAVVRLEPDGALDASFGTGGRASVVRAGSIEQGVKVLVQSDGRIVIAGTADVAPSGQIGHNDFGVARLNADGSLDSSFGTNGFATIEVSGRSDIVKVAALQGDGRIVVAGRVAASTSSNPDVGLARFNADGSVDTTFGDNGRTTRDVAGADLWDDVADIALQADGRIVLALLSRFEPTRHPFSVARFLGDGTLDTGFGVNGVASTQIGAANDYARGIAVDSGGRIIVVGSSEGATVSDLAVVRYLANGSLDTSFDGDGIFTRDLFGLGDEARTALVQPDGRLVVAGGGRNATLFTLVLLRLLP